MMRRDLVMPNTYKSAVMGCVDWLQTAAVLAKQTTVCPWWACRISDTLILPCTLSLCPACGQARTGLHADAVGHTHTVRVDWTGLDGAVTPVAPQGLDESTHWLTSYKVAWSKQGIIVISSLMWIQLLLNSWQDQLFHQLTQPTSRSKCSMNLALHFSGVSAAN